MIDWKGHLLTPQEIMDKIQTPEGRKEVAEYIWRARVAYGITRILDYLQIIPDAEQQQTVCLMMYETIFRVPVDEIMLYAQSVAEGLEITDYECAGNA